MPNITLAEMDEIDNKSKPKAKNITLAEMDAIDKESQKKPVAKQSEIQKPENRFGQYPMMAPMNPQALEDVARGIGQGVSDIFPNAMNRKIGNESIGSDIGKGIANTLTLAAPGKAISGAGKALEMIPGINKLFGSIRKAAESNKLLSGAGKTAKSAAEGAIGSAMITPENRLGAAEFGAPLNVLTQGTVGALSSGNPIINALARTAAGGAIGAGVGSMTPYGALQGAGTGATIGAGLPVAAKMLGISKLPPGREVLNHLMPEDVSKRFEAGLRTGRVLSPSEASGVGRLASPEASYARGGQAAIEKSKIAEGNIAKEKEFISKTLDDIYDKSESSAGNIRDLYGKAYKWNIKPEVVSQTRQDPIIDAAFKTVENDKAWQRKLTGVNPNNVAYLDKVKKVIQNEEGRLLRAGEKEKSKEYTEARKQLTNLLDESVPDYKKARAAAQLSIVRSNLDKKLVKTKGRGTDFYNKILSNDDEYNKLLGSLKNAPEAQDKLRDMKTAWEHLINPETPRGVYGKTETGLTQARNWFNTILETWQDMTGNKKGIEATKFFNSPEWPKAFKEIQRIKDKSQREKKMLQLLGSMGSIKAASNVSKTINE